MLISVLREEIGRNLRLLSGEAEEFLNYARDNKIVIVLSDLFFIELEDVISYNKQSVIEFIKEKGIIFEEVKMLQDDIENAKKFEKIGVHSPDSKHIAIAIRIKCDCIVTFNLKDFEKAAKFIQIIEPKYFKP